MCDNFHSIYISIDLGKLVCLNKWESSNQIGAVTLQQNPDGIPALLVAQPGGTFMRIRCNHENNMPEHNLDSARYVYLSKYIMSWNT